MDNDPSCIYMRDGTFRVEGEPKKSSQVTNRSHHIRFAGIIDKMKFSLIAAAAFAVSAKAHCIFQVTLFGIQPTGHDS